MQWMSNRASGSALTGAGSASGMEDPLPADPELSAEQNQGVLQRPSMERSADRLRRLHMMPPYNNGSDTSVMASVLRLHQSRYGLGDRRTLDQAIAFSGIDTKRREILGNRCGNIKYVPFEEHPLGPGKRCWLVWDTSNWRAVV